VVDRGDLDRQRRGILDYLVQGGKPGHGDASGHHVQKDGTVCYPDTHDHPFQGMALVSVRRVGRDILPEDISRYLEPERVDGLLDEVYLDYIA